MRTDVSVKRNRRAVLVEAVENRSVSRIALRGGSMGGEGGRVRFEIDRRIDRRKRRYDMAERIFGFRGSEFDSWKTVADGRGCLNSMGDLSTAIRMYPLSSVWIR